MPDDDTAENEGVVLVELMAKFASRNGVEHLLDLLEGAYLAFAPLSSEPRSLDDLEDADCDIEFVTVQ